MGMPKSPMVGQPLFRGKIPTQIAPGAADPARMRSGELRPRIPKPPAISSKPFRSIQAIGPQNHYKPRGL